MLPISERLTAFITVCGSSGPLYLQADTLSFRLLVLLSAEPWGTMRNVARLVEQMLWGHSLQPLRRSAKLDQATFLSCSRSSLAIWFKVTFTHLHTPSRNITQSFHSLHRVRLLRLQGRKTPVTSWKHAMATSREIFECILAPRTASPLLCTSVPGKQAEWKAQTPPFFQPLLIGCTHLYTIMKDHEGSMQRTSMSSIVILHFQRTFLDLLRGIL